MSYTEPLFNQISRFATSVGFGFIICILYLLLFFIRKSVSDKNCAVIIQDIVFGITATVMSFFYMIIYNNGEVRFNLLLGEITGSVVLYYSAGKYISPVLEKTAGIIIKTIGVIFIPLKLYFKAFGSFYEKVKSNITERKKYKQKAKNDVAEKQVKKSEGNKRNKNIKKRENNPIKPLKNQNKSV